MYAVDQCIIVILILQVHGLDEVEDFTSISSALLINMGTMSSDWVASKKLAARQVCCHQYSSDVGGGCVAPGGLHMLIAFVCNVHSHYWVCLLMKIPLHASSDAML
jgi:hypothetical protein